MRRAVARGRVFPQSYSTDRRYGHLSLKAGFLYPMMWANADDQGRLCGDPEEIKYAVCPNVDHITKQDIPGLLQELQDNKLIMCYTTPKSAAIQMLDWWEVHHPQWAWPSDYQPPEGWQDHLRFKKGAKEVVLKNWPVSGESSGESSGEKEVRRSPHPETEKETERGRGNSGEQLGTEIRSILLDLPESIDRLAEHEAVKDALAKIGRRKGFIPRSEVMTTAGRVDLTWELSGQVIAAFEIDPFWPRKKSLTKLENLDCKYRFVILRSNEEPLQWLEGILLIGLAKERESSKEREIETEEEKETEEEEGNSPDLSGEKFPSPSPTGDLITDSSEIFSELTDCFRYRWGRVPAQDPYSVIPREPDPRESAQLRDFAEELSSAGGLPRGFIKKAFDEAVEHEKKHISYVRAMLLDWLGLERGPPGEKRRPGRRKRAGVPLNE